MFRKSAANLQENTHIPKCDLIGMGLECNCNVKIKNKKSMKGIGLLRNLQSFLPRTSLLTIYKSFIRPHLDYGDVVYDRPSNNAFSNKSNKRYISRKIVSRIRVRISSTKAMDETPLLILQSCFN